MAPLKHLPAERRVRWLPVVLLVAGGLYLALRIVPPPQQSAFHLNEFGMLPVQNGGRIKPLDTIGRTALLMISGKQTVRLEGATLTALQWLTDVLFHPQQAGTYAVFEIDDPDVLGAMGIQQTRQRRFTWADVEPKTPEIERLATQADQIKPEQRSRFQTAVVNLQSRITLYQKLQNTLQVAGSENAVEALQVFETKLGPALKAHLLDPKRGSHRIGPLVRELERYRFLDHVAEFNPLPLYKNPGDGEIRRWVTVGSAVLARIGSDSFHPGVRAYAEMGDAWRGGDAASFNAALSSYQGWLKKLDPAEMRRSRYEFIFNYFAPFYRSMVLYLIVFLLVLGSWMAWPKTLNHSAYYLLILAFAVHTAGLFARMALQGRPPVTNLYSSAIFVGWVAVLLGIVLERLYRNGIGSMVASLIGFMTLIIAHHLASSGDTLEMMRAVLDSNFWLATHVVCITIGYGATFLSGFLATIYIVRRAFDRGWNEPLGATLERMVYGIVCFATLFSFVGTVLGGIWADQSWGRVWGWDPKENGALMIVLWNVFILHARWGGYADGKRLMVLAIVGNIVTSLSWFGVNMLGIGLHSYGFMDKAFVWLLVFIGSQLAIIGLGLRRRPR
jgi:ABC-type transport system involved in cytochrome c biogenesis permease subunit